MRNPVRSCSAKSCCTHLVHDRDRPSSRVLPWSFHIQGFWCEGGTGVLAGNEVGRNTVAQDRR